MNKWIVIHLTKGENMGNVITKKEEVALFSNQKAFIHELESIATGTGVSFSEYGTKCMINAYAALISRCKQDGIQLSDFDGALLRTAFSNIGYTELNFAANECYFDIRKIVEDKKVVGYTIAVRPQGVGNEKLVRKYGVNVKTLHPCWLVKDGDKLILPSFSGLKMTDPVWERDIKNINNKTVMCVYPVEIKGSDKVEYLMASRESVKNNLVAHIRQNLLYKFYGKERDQKYAELDKDADASTLDTLLANEKWRDYINPNWLSSSSRESMIIRKMQNNALKNYPKEYDSTQMKEAVQNMMEDYDESLEIKKEEAVEVDVVEKVEKEIQEKPVEGAIKDFNVDEDGVVTQPAKEEESKEIPEPKEEEYGF